MSQTQPFSPPGPLSTAVLFLVFNRPDVTAQVFEAIRKARPPRLYVAADGPRATREGEAARCAEVRRIATAVDWPCEVKTLFRDQNLGCKRAVSSGISWFFEHEEQGIILEDDCLPHPDFFAFCQDLLARYANDERVAMITGDNFQDGQRRGDASYYFSKYNHIWGWASWRRAWQHYDVNLAFWPEWRASTDWCSAFQDRVEQKYWFKIFNAVHQNKIDTWDYQWTASVWRNKQLTATPNVNLISNIGFGQDATHTFDTNSPHSNRAIQSIGQIDHPLVVEKNTVADQYAFDYVLGGRYLRFPRSLLTFPRRVVWHFLRKMYFLLLKLIRTAARRLINFLKFFVSNCMHFIGLKKRKYRKNSHLFESHYRDGSRALDVGSGPIPKNPFKATFIDGADIRGNISNNVVRCDLIHESLPFDDSSFDFVTLNDVIEHIPRVISINGVTVFPVVNLMNDVFRVLKPGGVVYCIQPVYPSKSAFQDPTHVNIMSEDTMYLYFCESAWARIYGFQGSFQLINDGWLSDKYFIFMRKSSSSPTLNLDFIQK